MLVKICGLTREKDVRVCEDLEVDFTGFIFHPKSPRCVSPEWVGSLFKSKTRRVGVFVHQDAEEIVDILDRAKLDLAQVHGGQDLKQCRQIGAERAIKVFWPERYANREELQTELELFAPLCRYFLLDSGTKGGGHGKVIESSILKDMSLPRPWILAGGLGAENVHNLIQSLQPDGVDLNSGVENSPGIKNNELLKSVVGRIRQ